MKPGRGAARPEPDGEVVDGLTVSVNGERRHVGARVTVAQLVAQWCASPDGIAVALNRQVVPKSAWPSTLLADHDDVEIVTATAGG